jgi:hypothetical protein
VLAGVVLAMLCHDLVDGGILLETGGRRCGRHFETNRNMCR